MTFSRQMQIAAVLFAAAGILSSVSSKISNPTLYAWTIFVVFLLFLAAMLFVTGFLCALGGFLEFLSLKLWLQ